MAEVAVDLEPERGGAFSQALVAAGFATAGGAPWARLVEALDVPFEDVTGLVEWVLAGGVLAICGGTGPLLALLNLTPGDSQVEGPVEPSAPGAPPLPLASAWPVTGVGYAIYRCGELCVALAGRRGKGWIVYALDPALLAASLSWVHGR